MQDFRKLEVWRKARHLSRGVYLATRGFPRDELFGLTAQMRQCAVSIGANVAEGCGRGTQADLARFLRIAFGSACELEHHLIVAKDSDYLTARETHDLGSRVLRIKRMLSGLLRSVRESGLPTTENR